MCVPPDTIVLPYSLSIAPFATSSEDIRCSPPSDAIGISLLRPYVLVLTSSNTGSQQNKRGRKASLLYFLLLHAG
jgi:hypothetical protein